MYTTYTEMNTIRCLIQLSSEVSLTVSKCLSQAGYQICMGKE